jgi:hypothetical protein
MHVKSNKYRSNAHMYFRKGTERISPDSSNIAIWKSERSGRRREPSGVGLKILPRFRTLMFGNTTCADGVAYSGRSVIATRVVGALS